LSGDLSLDGVVQLKNMREALREFRLTRYQLMMAVQRRELRRVQLGGEGRVYYLEDELRALAGRASKPHYIYAA
jgi:hypothetical protein